MAEQKERVSSIVMHSLPRLTSVMIGDESLEIRQNEEGNIVTYWPWTGRMEAGTSSQTCL